MTRSFHEGHKVSRVQGGRGTGNKGFFKKWTTAYPESQPQYYGDIHIQCNSVGRPGMLQEAEESTIVDAIKHFADHNTPLTRCQIQDLVTHYMSMLPHSRQQDLKFANNRPLYTLGGPNGKPSWATA